MAKLISRFLSCSRGQGFAEYSVLLIFLSVGAALSSMIIERHVTTLWNVSSFTLTSISSGSAEGAGNGAAAGNAAASVGSSNVRAVSHTMTGGRLSEDNRPRMSVVHDGESASVSTAPASDLISEDLSDS